MKLTAKQKKFADNYIKSGNATQSAIEAGYSEKSAQVIGAENLLKPMVKSYIDSKMNEIESHKIADAKEVLEFFTDVLRGKAKEIAVVGTPYGVEEVEKPPDIKAQMSAGKELMKRYPESNELLQAQIRKAKAEADIREAEANIANGNGAEIPDDGFLNALKQNADEVWSDDNEDETKD